MSDIVHISQPPQSEDGDDVTFVSPIVYDLFICHRCSNTHRRGATCICDIQEDVTLKYSKALLALQELEAALQVAGPAAGTRILQQAPPGRLSYNLYQLLHQTGAILCLQPPLGAEVREAAAPPTAQPAATWQPTPTDECSMCGHHPHENEVHTRICRGCKWRLCYMCGMNHHRAKNCPPQVPYPFGPSPRWGQGPAAPLAASASSMPSGHSH